MALRSLIESNQGDVAFIIGNGINRYPDDPPNVSWEGLLLELWKTFANREYVSIPKGLSITEFYDLLEAQCSDDDLKQSSVQKKVCGYMEPWKPNSHHHNIVSKINQINAPILTTNFDLTLANSLKLKQFYTESKSFTDFYPWTTYYGKKKLEFPTDGFGIWFINGFINYHRSIRLGLTHYMGCVERARNLIHKGIEDRLFTGKDVNNWKGSKTWLHILFNKSLCIFGLELNENEVFLRWLLIERYKYFRRFPDRLKKGWYIQKRNNPVNENDEGKKFFLSTIGIEFLEVDNYDDIYSTPWS